MPARPSTIGVTPNMSPSTTSGSVTTLSRFCHHGLEPQTRISPLMRVYSELINPMTRPTTTAIDSTKAAAAAITASVMAPALIASTTTAITKINSNAPRKIAMPMPKRLMPSRMPSLILSQVDFSASRLALAAISLYLAGASCAP